MCHGVQYGKDHNNFNWHLLKKTCMFALQHPRAAEYSLKEQNAPKINGYLLLADVELVLIRFSMFYLSGKSPKTTGKFQLCTSGNCMLLELCKRGPTHVPGVALPSCLGLIPELARLAENWAREDCSSRFLLLSFSLPLLFFPFALPFFSFASLSCFDSPFPVVTDVSSIHFPEDPPPFLV